jgi:cell division protein ZapA
MLAGRAYPLKVSEEEEQMVYRVVSEVNEKIKNFQMTYNKKDKQDCLSMTLLTYAVEYHKAKQGHSLDALKARTKEIDQQLERLLS